MRTRLGLCGVVAMLFGLGLPPALVASGPRILIGEGGRHRLLIVDRASHQVVAERAAFRRIDCLARLSPDEFLVCDGSSLIRIDTNLNERSGTTSAFDVHYAARAGVGTLLIGNETLNTIDEVDAHGNLLWSVPVHFPSGAVRLPNGHTLVADGTAILKEFDASGAVRARTLLRNWAASLHRFASGQTLVGESLGYEMIDAGGRSVWFRESASRVSCIHPLAAGELLLCEPDTGRIVIVDRDGQLAWEMGPIDYGWWAFYLE
jgi:hypothetical protein